MTAAYPAASAVAPVARAVRAVAIAAAVVAGGIVYVEPSPYEFVSGLAIVACLVTGLRFHARLWPLVFLLTAYIAFGAIAATRARPLGDGAMWMAVSAFLAATAILFAAFVAERPDRNFRIVAWAYVVACVVPAGAAILGYFGVAGADIFLLYGRARGTFQDPNVLGPFLVMPFLFLAEGALRGNLRQALLRGLFLMPIALALLLTFSRGAWMHLVLSVMLLGALTFVLSASTVARMRIVLVAAIGLIAVGLVIATALSVPKVQSLFTERAQLAQEYDTGRDGRFGRWTRGFALALEEPLGIGPLQFAKHFPEDPHNVYLNSLMSFGWGGFLAYVTTVLSTIALAFRALLVPTPWRRHIVVAFSTFVPLALLGGIIDTDHWRHFFLVLGCLWGLIAATRVPRDAL